MAATRLDAVPAPAKLNLFLRVLGRRADGYHLLQTLFRFIDYGDTLDFVATEDGEITRLGDSPASVEEDLCLRAARLLQQTARVRAGAQIHLTKRIPIGGGLGGGSSDAATTLIALNRLWQVNYSRLELQQLALQFGADVPVFIFGENALAEGIGERLHTVSLPRKWYVVLAPNAFVSTREVFNDAELTRNSNPLKLGAFSLGESGNDLESVVCRRYPAVAEALNWLRKNAERAGMTGSGACVFAEFDSKSEARRILAAAPIDGFVAKGLDCHPLKEWL
ncbi:MAG: 4-(cytidine 5'-diphospho)-2-C-methyl-D-erythritol kinase [Burkholderiales bacterium]